MSENRPEVNLYEMAKLLKGQSITLLHTRRVQSSSFKETQQSYKVKSEEVRRGEEELYISITLLVGRVCKSVSRCWAWTSWTLCGNCSSFSVWCETKETALVLLMRNKCQHIVAQVSEYLNLRDTAHIQFWSKSCQILGQHLFVVNQI